MGKSQQGEIVTKKIGRKYEVIFGVDRVEIEPSHPQTKQNYPDTESSNP